MMDCLVPVEEGVSMLVSGDGSWKPVTVNRLLFIERAQVSFSPLPVGDVGRW